METWSRRRPGRRIPRGSRSSCNCWGLVSSSEPVDGSGPRGDAFDIRARPAATGRPAGCTEGQTMCSVFVTADPELYSSYTRSIRLHGVSTSLRLERMFWDVLAEIGARDAMSVPQLISKLHDELVAAGADLGNFASFLRVCCLRYLSLQAVGVIPTDRSISIRSLGNGHRPNEIAEIAGTRDRT